MSNDRPSQRSTRAYSTCFFETPRLLFRAFEPDDLDALAAINADVETSRYVGDGEPLDRATTALWIERSRTNVATFGYGTGALIEKASDQLIGWAGVARPDDQPEEIVYGFDRARWHRGLGSELLPALIAFVSDVLGHPAIRATVHPANTASIAMLERQGFRLVDDCFDGDPLCHLFVLSKTASRSG